MSTKKYVLRRKMNIIESIEVEATNYLDALGKLVDFKNEPTPDNAVLDNEYGIIEYTGVSDE